MKSGFPTANFLLLHLLSCLNVVLPADSRKCTVSGISVIYKAGDQMNLKCDGGTDQQTKWTFRPLQSEHLNRSDITPAVGNSSILTIKHVTTENSGIYGCYCSDDEFHELHVLVIRERISVLTDNCEVVLRLRVTVRDTDYKNVSFTSLLCPTLKSHRTWNFPSEADHPGEHELHMFTVGNSGGANHTCNFTVIYRYNGADHQRTYSKKVVGNPSCIEKSTLDESACAEKKPAALTGRATSRNPPLTAKLMVFILLCHSVKWHNIWYYIVA